jgi:hypothetical protein
MASARRLACDRDAHGSQLQLRLDEHVCAARASAAAARSCSCRRISASTSIVKKLCIAAPVLLHHDSVDGTWQRMICEGRKRGELGCDDIAPCYPITRVAPDDRTHRRQCRGAVPSAIGVAINLPLELRAFTCRLAVLSSHSRLTTDNSRLTHSTRILNSSASRLARPVT